MEQCLHALMMASANDVANAVAEHVAGSLDAFVDMMNARAEEIGATDTHFVNAHGLHSDDHYTTAYDLALHLQRGVEASLLSRTDRGNVLRDPSHESVQRIPLFLPKTQVNPPGYFSLL
ncbi:MAG: D-alanyl-D-alanine carboxypeptidase family protein [Clostridia bacterium]